MSDVIDDLSKNETVQAVKEKAGEAVETVKDKVGDMFDDLSKNESVQAAKEKVSETIEQAAQEVKKSNLFGKLKGWLGLK